MDEHTVNQDRVGAKRRWLCTCGWATRWTIYTDPAAAAAAIRHQLQGESQ